MRKLIYLTTCLVLTGCTINISMAHTQGMATDTIDDNQTATPTISPTVSVPAM